jgi:hypothetical protein
MEVLPHVPCSAHGIHDYFCVLKVFIKKIKIFYFFLYFKLIFICFVFIDHFNIMMSKIILKNKKYIILIYFKMKNTLKSNRNHTFKHAAGGN